MERGPDDPVPEPPEGYEMSEAFRTWLVERMRKEVLGDTNMAILKRD